MRIPRLTPRACAAALVSLAMAALLLLGSSACTDGGQRESERVWFEERAEERGLAFRHVRGSETRHWFPEIMGSGPGLLDYDDDGDLDIYLVQSGDLSGPNPELSNRLFRNAGDARFEDATDRAHMETFSIQIS